MQKMRRLMLVGFASFIGLAPVTAGAVILTHDPGAPVCLSAGAPAPCNGSAVPSVDHYDFSFDLTGVVGADQIITDALLTLVLSDDKGQADGNEFMTLHLDGNLVPTAGDVQNNLEDLTVDLALLSDNILHVKLGVNGDGDYFFGGSTLDLTLEDRPGDPVPDPTRAVPVPASLVLLGLGLGAAAARRLA